MSDSSSAPPTFGPDTPCTLDTCDVRDSVYQYRPSIAANTIFLVIFALVMIVQVVQAFRWKTWGYAIAMVLGCICEIIGYGGRIMLWINPFNFDGFLLQIILVTFAPAFFAAAIYLTLTKTVIYLGREHSRFSPNLFYWIFIPCDVVSLTLQAAGGGLSTDTGGSSQTGVNVAIAGLAFQVFTLTVFCVLAVDYAIRWRKGSGGLTANGEAISKPFKTFAGFLTAATILVLIRCAYRIDELSEGYDGPLISNEGLFIALEGAMVAAAAVALTIGHPGFGLPRSVNRPTKKGRRGELDVEEK